MTRHEAAAQVMRWPLDSKKEFMKNIKTIIELSREAEKEYPPNICSYKSAFFRCTREKHSNTDYCFWHIPDENKFDPEFCSVFFLGKHDRETIKEALEVEIKENRSLEGAFLNGLNLTHLQPNFEGGNFRDADMQGFHFGYGSVRGCNFIGANLESANLCDCDIREANFTDTRLHNVKFRDNDFSTVIGIKKDSFMGLVFYLIPKYKINELKNTEGVCAEVYRRLKLLFNNNGHFDDASWAAYREKVMLRNVLKSQLKVETLLVRSYFENRNLTHNHRIRLSLAQSVVNRLKYYLSHIYSALFGYGEKPLRVVIASAITILVYAWTYYFFDVLKDSTGKVAGEFVDGLYFSIVTFTTLGYGDLTPLPKFRLFAASEALLGAFLVGLFLFTLSRRAIGRA